MDAMRRLLDLLTKFFNMSFSRYTNANAILLGSRSYNIKWLIFSPTKDYIPGQHRFCKEYF